MKSIRALKEHRREKLCQLMEAVGQTRLASITGIAPAFLYQMSAALKGARNVSDANARNIEESVGLPRGWLDSDLPVPAGLEDGGGIEATPTDSTGTIAQLEQDIDDAGVLISILVRVVSETTPGAAEALIEHFSTPPRDRAPMFAVALQAATEARQQAASARLASVPPSRGGKPPRTER